jgi:putative oxidoreductase
LRGRETDGEILGDGLAARLRRLDRSAILFTARHGPLFSRLTLGLVFTWFGVLKITGASPVAELVEQVLRAMPLVLTLEQLGWIEVVIGLLLVAGVALRLTLLVFFLHMLGTFSVFVVDPELAFVGGNPLRLTTLGEFVVKNLVLMAAGLFIVASLRRSRERMWSRASDRAPPANRS